MVKQSKWISILCAMMIGVLFFLAVTAVLLVSGILSLNKTNLTFTTEGVEALYDGVPLTNHNWRLVTGSLKPGHQLEVACDSSQTNVGECKNALTIKITDELGADVTSDYAINYKLGTLKVNPRTLVITSASASKEYDGEPLSSAEYELSPDCDGLVPGHTVSVIVTGFLVEPGKTSNTIESVHVYDEYGNDVTSNYRLILREGLLVMEGESVGGGGGDGPGADTPGEGGDESEDIVFDGSSSLLPNDNNKDVVLFSIYSDTADTVYLRIQSCGDYNGTGWDQAVAYPELIFGEYAASYLTSYALNGPNSAVYSMEIKSHCGSYALPYYPLFDTGNYLRPVDDIGYAGVPEDNYTVQYYQYLSENVVNVPSAVRSYEKDYRVFVYDNYLNIDSESLAYMQNLIAEQRFDKDDPHVINKVASYIQHAAVYDLEYNTDLDKEENIAIAFLETYKEGVCRHYASAATLLFRALGIPARYTVGVMTQTRADSWTTVKGDRAHAWVEVYIDGLGWVMVEVTGSSDQDGSEDDDKIILTPETHRFQYDGKTHNVQDIENPKLRGFDKLEKLGYSYEVVISGEASEPGKHQTVIEQLTIYDPNHRDVTDQFNIECRQGLLQIYYEHFVFESVDWEMIYRDAPPDVYVQYDHEIDEYLNVEFKSTAAKNVGEHLNSFSVTLTDKEGNHVTDCYWVEGISGSLKITPLEITVKAADAQKVYDGTPLTADEYEIVDGLLANGHTIGFCEISGEQTAIGRSDNVITYITIFDADGKDMTSNYLINLLTGKLKVTIK